MKRLFTLMLAAALAATTMITANASTFSFDGDIENYKPSRNEKEDTVSTWFKPTQEKYDLEFYTDPQREVLKGEVLFTLFRAAQSGQSQSDNYNPLRAPWNFESKFADLNSLVPAAQEEMEIIEYYDLLKGTKEADGEYYMNLDVPITRAEMATIIYYFNSELFGFYSMRDAIDFKDVESTSWYNSYVDYAYQIGLVNGSGGNRYNPTGNLTVEEFLTICDNITQMAKDHDREDAYVFDEENLEIAIERTFKIVADFEEVKATNVTLDVSTITLKVDSEYELEWDVFPSATTDKSVTFTSSNNSIATVDEDGVITGEKSGTATITIKTASGKTDTVKVTVNTSGSTDSDSDSDKDTDTEITEISLPYGDDVTLKKGQSYTFEALIYPDIDDVWLNWYSTNSSIVSVTKQSDNTKATLTAKAAGTCEIVVEAKNGNWTSIEVTVDNDGNITTDPDDPTNPDDPNTGTVVDPSDKLYVEGHQIYSGNAHYNYYNATEGQNFTIEIITDAKISSATLSNSSAIEQMSATATTSNGYTIEFKAKAKNTSSDITIKLDNGTTFVIDIKVY